MIVGWENIYDCEAADTIILDAGFTAVRPTELTDSGDPAGVYTATADSGMSFRGAVHKGDVGRFLCDEIEEGKWVKAAGTKLGVAVQLYK